MPYGAIASTKIPLGLWLLVLAGGVLWSDANAQLYKAPSKAISEQLVTAINDLARNLGQQFGASGGNSSKTELFSPVSIGSMMFLLLRMVNQNTRSELIDVLQLEQVRKQGNIPKNFARLLKEFTHDIAGKGILEELPGWHTSSGCYPRMEGVDYAYEEYDDDQYLDEPIQPNVVQLANGIFVQNGLMNSTNTVKLAKELYQAQIQQVNFREEPETVRATINQWVNESTRGRIEEILSDNLDSSTQIVIANALYFKGTWETFFNEPQYTRKQTFFPDGEDQPSVMVPMMFAGGCFPYYASTELNARIMAFPYRNRTTSMYIILPNESNRAKVRELQAKLSSAVLDQLIGEMRLQKAIVQFPRMHVTNTYNLKRTLQQLGIRTLFDRTKNNLKIVAPASRTDTGNRLAKLYVSEMMHKIDLDVNERGTEGGAVTITAMERSLPPVNFRVRGPFILAIRHDPTKMLLFYGAVFDPS